MHDDADATRSPGPGSTSVAVIPLANAPGERAAWDRSRFIVYLWAIVERLVVTNSWQISSRLRIAALRAFGADIDAGVIFRPRTRVTFPWKLHIGRDSWIGEGVWFHNQDHIFIGHDVVISQESFLTTGSHRHRRDMALTTAPITIEPGAWITARCIILKGSVIGASAVVGPGCVVNGPIAANTVVEQSGLRRSSHRFPPGATGQDHAE